MGENSVRRCWTCAALEVFAGGESLLVLVDGRACSEHALPKAYPGGIFDVREAASPLPADARLIAAAPDLLDALIAAVPLLVDDWEGARGLISPGKEVIEAARAAIDKATKEES